MKVDSEVIADIMYDDYVDEMTVTFQNKTVYTYIDVNKEIYLDFIDAESKGKFFHLYIKNNFNFRKE